MSKADCKIRIGTSGWYYDHWKELFYPVGLAKSKWFEYYAQYFDTVEINNTFYHLPKEQTLQRWHDIVPKDFLYAVKANRYITHITGQDSSFNIRYPTCGVPYSQNVNYAVVRIYLVDEPVWL